MLYDLSNLLTSGDLFVGTWSFLETTVNIPISELLLVVIFFVAFFTIKQRWDSMRAIMGASIAVAFSSIMIWAAKLIAIQYVYGTVVLAGATLIITYFWER